MTILNVINTDTWVFKMNEPKIELTLAEAKILLYALATSPMVDKTFGTWQANELLNSLSDKIAAVMEWTKDGK